MLWAPRKLAPLGRGGLAAAVGEPGVEPNVYYAAGAAVVVLLLAARRVWRRKPARPAAIPRPPADARGRRIGILVVAYNAVTTLSATLKRIPKDVWDQIEEVAVFDDASRDETFELAVGFKTLFGVEKLTVLRNEKNLGYGGNQMRGYRYFADRGFDVVVMLHGDGQYAPEVLADLYRPIVAGEADAVFGSRDDAGLRRAAEGRDAAVQVPREQGADQVREPLPRDVAEGVPLRVSGVQPARPAEGRLLPDDPGLPLRHPNHHQAPPPGAAH
ncbi:MAG: hypothetical protein C0501_17910 [Isosphaera sp.]|nr:hypothetical protein [Isosphaera sp.]